MLNTQDDQTHQNGPFQDQPTKTIGPSFRLCHINIEGISRAKSEFLSKLLLDNNVDAVLIQETHAPTAEDLRKRGRIYGYELIGATYHKAYGVATYVRNTIEHAHLVSTNSTNEIHNVTINLDGFLINNIYKPPKVMWPLYVLPTTAHPSIYAGDFNSHHELWKYAQNNECGVALSDWAENNNLYLAFDAKDLGTFRSAAWQRDFNTDLCFVSYDNKGHPIPVCRKVLPNFPHSQHRPVIVNIGLSVPLAECSPRPRWNFRKANWQGFADHLDGFIHFIPPEPNNYCRFVGAVLAAAKKHIPRGFRKEYIPGWSEQCEHLYEEYSQSGDSDIADDLLHELDAARRLRWSETVQSLDFKHSSRRAWKLLRRLGGASEQPGLKPNVTANTIANHIVETSRSTCDKQHTSAIKRELTSLKAQCPNESQFSSAFTLTELNAALKQTKQGKAPGFDNIHPEFLTSLGNGAKEWLTRFFSNILDSGSLPKELKKTKIVAILKPGKSPDLPQHFRPISLLSSTYKLLERLIYNRISGLILEHIPDEQAGFRPDRSCCDQVLALTTFIEASFQQMLKTAVAFVDLTAAYDTVWRDGMIYKFLKITRCRKTASLLNNMLSNRFFRTYLGGSVSKEKKLMNGLPQGSVLAPLLFNIYIADLPNTRSTKFCYADDIALAFRAKDLSQTEPVLSEDLSVLNTFFNKWRLRPSSSKTEVCAFHLNNRQANAKLQIQLNGNTLRHNNFPKYLGVTLDRTLSFRKHLENTAAKLKTRNNIIQKLCGTTWGASADTLRTSSLALVYSTAEYCAPVWLNSCHTHLIDVQLNHTMRLISGAVRPTPTYWLPLLSNTYPPEIRRTEALLKEFRKLQENPGLPLHDDIPTLRLNRLRSRNPPLWKAEQLDINNIRRKDQWIQSCQRIEDPEARRWFEGYDCDTTGTNLDRQKWVKLNRIRSGYGRCGDSLHKWGLADSPSCDCGAPRQTIKHIREECPLRPFQGRWSDFMKAEEFALDWIENLDINI